ncbi:MBL fold metallo-hydrolase [Enterococcus hirae]|uniref:hypothetical protein n=1 Tax=Enterococcus hirae TaxID=1354 RepID=UPI0039827602
MQWKLIENYPRQMTDQEAMKEFILRLSNFFGDIEIVKSITICSDDQRCSEIVYFSNGSQFKIDLKRDPGTYEIKCLATYHHNKAYLEKLTAADYEYLCHLAMENLVRLKEIPGVKTLDQQEARENEILSFLVPKLMIITGQATENNFN